jgi:hypothetical protein
MLPAPFGTQTACTRLKQLADHLCIIVDEVSCWRYEFDDALYSKALVSLKRQQDNIARSNEAMNTFL